MKGLGSRVPWGEISRRRGMVTVLAATRLSSCDGSAPNLARKDSGLRKIGLRQLLFEEKWLKKPFEMNVASKAINGTVWMQS